MTVVKDLQVGLSRKWMKCLENFRRPDVMKFANYKLELYALCTSAS